MFWKKLEFVVAGIVIFHRRTYYSTNIKCMDYAIVSHPVRKPYCKEQKICEPKITHEFLAGIKKN